MRIASAKGWLVIGALGAAVMLVLGWTLIVSPLRDQTAAVQDEAAAQLAANATAQDTVARLKSGASGLPAQKARMEALSATIPASEQMPELVRALHGAATATGVTLVEVTPASPVPVAAATADGGATAAAGLQEVPLSIAVTGTYAQTRAFLGAVEGLQRAVLVRGFDLGESAGGEEGVVRTAIRAGVFINPTLGTAPAASAAAAPAAPADPGATAS